MSSKVMSLNWPKLIVYQLYGYTNIIIYGAIHLHIQYIMERTWKNKT
jgi:hypothetical protein